MEKVLADLCSRGYSPWLAYLRRGMFASGEMQTLIEQGIRGVAASLLLLARVLGGSPDYPLLLRQARRTFSDAGETLEFLVREDIRAAADLLLPIYRQTAGMDGYACLDLDPLTAREEKEMVTSCHRLWGSVDRPNVMVKLPATAAGLRAAETLLAEGIPVNLDLVFSPRTYEEAASVYLRALERRSREGRGIQEVSSVVSFPLGSLASVLPQGEWAILLARHIYARSREIFTSPRFSSLQERGARPQRLLWSNLSESDPRRAPTSYLDSLLAANGTGLGTVLSLTPSLLASLGQEIERGSIYPEPGKEGEEARQGGEVLRSGELPSLGEIDLDEIEARLQEEELETRSRSLKAILDHLQSSLSHPTSPAEGPPFWTQLDPLSSALSAARRETEDERIVARIWGRDHRVWKPDPREIVNRLGWLDLPDRMQRHVRDLEVFAHQVREAGFHQALLLGMGGSSLAPEVLRATFDPPPAPLQLMVLDSTIPSQIARIARSLDLARTLFLVSSKSGTTIEVLCLFSYFWSLVQQIKGDLAGENFVAITDPGTPLEDLARSHGFRRLFPSHPDLGGRYSALSHFGLVPASLLGLELGPWLERAEVMAESCAPCVPLPDNPGASLGSILAASAQQGRDKLTLFTSPALSALGLWIEQLLAESLGKEGRGIIPVVGEPSADPSAYTRDRLFVFLRLEGDENGILDQQMRSLLTAGHPALCLSLSDRYHLAAEFFRWEFATALAAARLSLHPFDQPNVEESKENTRSLLASLPPGSQPPLQPMGSLPQLLSQARPGDYVALMAFLEQTPTLEAAFADLRRLILERYHLPSTLGFGPRFLHSTGQLHKGGPERALFVQFTGDTVEDLPIPGRPYTFGTLAAAQAQGDLQSLLAKGRRVIRIHLGGEAERGVRELIATLT